MSQTQYFGYIRVSTRLQSINSASLFEQRRAIEEFATTRGLTVTRWFEENEAAAKTGRKIFRVIVEELLRTKSHGLIIHKIDRGARNLRDWAEIGELIDLGIDVRFAHDDLRLDSRGGRLAADIQAVVAADYIRNLREEIRKGFMGALKQGLYPLAAPYGYRSLGSRRAKVPEPNAAAVVRELFAQYATGTTSVRELSELMQARGIRGVNHGTMSLNVIWHILRNPFYTGRIVIRKTGQMFPGVHEPLIAQQTFDHVQALLSRSKPRPRKRHTFLYQGLVQCECGRMYVGERIRDRYTYYRCHRCKISIREDKLEERLLAAMPPTDVDPNMPAPARIRAGASLYILGDGEQTRGRHASP